MKIPIKLIDGDTFDAQGPEYFKYWTPQDIVAGGLFLMKEIVDRGYEGYVILYKPDPSNEEWVEKAYFSKDTVASYGIERTVPHFFNGKTIIRLSMTQKDGDGKE